MVKVRRTKTLNNDNKNSIQLEEVCDVKGFYVVAMTDRYIVGEWPISGKDTSLQEHKILELRIFNEDVEYKWYRGNIGEKFRYRKISDNEAKEIYEEPFEEYQLLDIDLQKSSIDLLPCEVKTAKGGKYYLPINGINNIKKDFPYVKVKYYIPKYNPEDKTTVHSYVKDWRLAGFCVKNSRDKYICEKEDN